MLRANNPDIDFDVLNSRVKARLDKYELTKAAVSDFNESGEYPASQCSAAAPEAAPSIPLVALHDQEFIEQAFLQVLGRKADAEGLAHYLKKLREGEDKRAILTRLRYSSEGRQQARSFNAGANLRLTRLKERLFRVPLLGRCFSSVSVLLGLPSYRRHENAQFNHLHRLADQWREQFEEQQRVITRLQKKADVQQADHEARINLLASQMQQQRVASEASSGALNATINTLEAQCLASSRGVSQLRLRINDLERGASNALAGQGGVPAASGDPALAQVVEAPVEDAFYAAFEEHFRGSEEVIRQRLEYYVPVLKACDVLREGGRFADIGCGRGEWLDVLADQGYQGLGIDLNQHNVECSRARGHEVLLGDGLRWLKEQDAESLAAISSFHVIEHLTFSQLNIFLVEALRVLKPGGMILLETPNPENLVTGITHFYTDPTHLHPLPPAFTEFLLTYKGFTSAEVHRLNPIPAEYALLESSEVDRRCNQLFYGPQDYAVVAFKSA